MNVCKVSFIFTLLIVITLYTMNAVVEPKVTLSETAKSFKLKHRPALVAHRGGRGVRPENTMTAMNFSYHYYKPDIMETDIHMTKDGEFIFSHDARLERTTNGTGFIRDHTLEELRSLDFGYHYTDGNVYPYRNKGIKCTTLKEVYEEFKDKNIMFSVEIKSRTVESIDRLVEYLKEMPGCEKFMCFCCANHALSEYFKKLTNHEFCYEASEFDVVSYIVVGMAKLSNLYYHFVPNDNRFMFAPFISIGGVDFMNKNLLEPQHTIGLETLYFTVNNRQDAAICIGKNCTGITTDRPDMVEELLHAITRREMQQKENYEKIDSIISRDAVDIKWICETKFCLFVDAFTNIIPIPVLLSIILFIVLFFIFALIQIFFWILCCPFRLCCKKKVKKE